MDKDERKKKLKEFKEQERQELIYILPMSEALLKDFFEYLAQNVLEEEHDRFRLTKIFCDNKGLDFTKVKDWAGELGGFSDQEIVWNVEQQYEFLLGDNYQK